MNPTPNDADRSRRSASPQRPSLTESHSLTSTLHQVEQRQDEIRRNLFALKSQIGALQRSPESQQSASPVRRERSSVQSSVPATSFEPNEPARAVFQTKSNTFGLTPEKESRASFAYHDNTSSAESSQRFPSVHEFAAASASSRSEDVFASLTQIPFQAVSHHSSRQISAQSPFRSESQSVGWRGREAMGDAAGIRSSSGFGQDMSIAWDESRDAVDEMGRSLDQSLGIESSNSFVMSQKPSPPTRDTIVSSGYIRSGSQRGGDSTYGKRTPERMLRSKPIHETPCERSPLFDFHGAHDALRVTSIETPRSENVMSSRRPNKQKYTNPRTANKSFLGSYDSHPDIFPETTNSLAQAAESDLFATEYDHKKYVLLNGSDLHPDSPVARNHYPGPHIHTPDVFDRRTRQPHSSTISASSRTNAPIKSPQTNGVTPTRPGKSEHTAHAASQSAVPNTPNSLPAQLDYDDHEIRYLYLVQEQRLRILREISYGLIHSLVQTINLNESESESQYSNLIREIELLEESKLNDAILEWELQHEAHIDGVEFYEGDS